MELGWAVIGCSDIVRKRGAPALRTQTHSRLVAICSRDRDRAQAFSEEFDAEYGTDDLDQVLSDDRIEAVYVATEVDRHSELALAALYAGKHVLVEKPMALNVTEARTMIEAARASGVHLSVAYYARFFEKSRIMKQVIEKGWLGEIVRAVVRTIGFYDPVPSDPKYWRVTERGGGNTLADLGSHRLDLLCHFLGRPTEVLGLADRLTMRYAACDTETALIRFESGAHVVAMANANVRHPGALPTSIEIYGTEGSLLTDPWNGEPVTVVGCDHTPIPVTQPQNAHFPLIDDFASSLVGGGKPQFDGADGLWATALIAGAYESSRTGKAVAIE